MEELEETGKNKWMKECEEELKVLNMNQEKLKKMTKQDLSKMHALNAAQMY